MCMFVGKKGRVNKEPRNRYYVGAFKQIARMELSELLPH